MTRLLRFPTATEHEPAVMQWFLAHPGDLGAAARYWFDVMRGCGDDVRELLHDGAPTVCVGDAAFAYVNVFRSHVNVGFFRGAELADPAGMLEGAGRFMRHVKVGPNRAPDAQALAALVATAYADMQARVAAEERQRNRPRPGPQ